MQEGGVNHPKGPTKWGATRRGALGTWGPLAGVSGVPVHGEAAAGDPWARRSPAEYSGFSGAFSFAFVF